MVKNTSSNQIFSGLFWKFGERFLAQGVSFCVSVVLARLVSPDDHGIIAMVMIFMTLAEVFVTSGFSTALIQKKDANTTDFSTIFYCSLACSLVVYLILFAAAPIIADFYREPLLQPVLRVFALRIPLSAYNSVQQAYVSRHMMFQRFFFSTLAGTLVSGVVGIALAYLNFGVWALIAQYFTNTIVNTLVLSITVSWHPEAVFSCSSAKRLMSYGWKVLASDFAGIFFDQLRGLIIGRVYTSTDLAYYNKGQQIPSLLADNISTSVMAVLFPALSNKSDDLTQVKQMTKRAVRLMSYVIFPMMVGLAVVARPLVLLLFSDTWQASIPFMRLLCIASAVTLIGTTSLQAIKAIGRSDVLLKIEFWKKPVYLVFLILGVRRSVYATAVTMVLYAFYGTFVNILQLKKYLNYSIVEQILDIIPSMVLAGSMGVLVSGIMYLHLSVTLTLALQVAVGVLYYVGLSWLLKVESFIYLKNFIAEKLGRFRK